MIVGNALFRECDHHFADEWGDRGSIESWHGQTPLGEIPQHCSIPPASSQPAPHQRLELYGHRRRNRSPVSSRRSASNAMVPLQREGMAEDRAGGQIKFLTNTTSATHCRLRHVETAGLRSRATW